MIFADVDLSHVKGLESVIHQAPSTIGIDTIIRSRGNIPEVFLQRAGIPKIWIIYTHSLIDNPINFYSCFISYSSRDQTFTKRLYADLQSKGVRCWFAPEDLKIGDKIRPRVDESIRLYDKLLLVLSQYSVASQWVEQEVERALARERQENKIILFPIRLDKTVMDIEEGWPALIHNTRSIGDFTRWKHHDEYQKALDRLLRDLKAEFTKEGR
ncbi:MAG: toll/interleukin-1 receptor domain-containing protein [Ktedonobacteraceae bacterium]|nr:toll/interleukin-1 receptor domain-containing protein [Ktedonobacteraceae bacterium]MBO0790405.1 toll/interleukin-1 receptor domain-containing protein [Ktedonobacteraceae bacterium]